MKPVAALAVVVLTSLGCSKEAPPPPTTTTPALPLPLEAAQRMYADYAKAPTTWNRVPHLSRFYVEDSQRKDKACNESQNCTGDRFVCLDRSPTRPGTVTSAKLNGEQPGVSATALLGLQFGAEKPTVEVDVVWEDGAWKIDQVRCPAETP